MGITLVRKNFSAQKSPLEGGNEKFPLVGDGLGIPGMKGARYDALDGFWVMGAGGWFSRRAAHQCKGGEC